MATHYYNWPLIFRHWNTMERCDYTRRQQRFPGADTHEHKVMFYHGNLRIWVLKHLSKALHQVLFSNLIDGWPQVSGKLSCLSVQRGPCYPAPTMMSVQKVLNKWWLLKDGSHWKGACTKWSHDSAQALGMEGHFLQPCPSHQVTHPSVHLSYKQSKAQPHTHSSVHCTDFPPSVLETDWKLHSDFSSWYLRPVPLSSLLPFVY